MSAPVDEIKRYMSERNQELNEENSKLRRDNAALLAAAKAVVAQLDNYQTIDDSGSDAFPQLLTAISQAESEAKG